MNPGIIIAETIGGLHKAAMDVNPPLSIDETSIREFNGLDLFTSAGMSTGGFFSTGKIGYVAFATPAKTDTLTEV